MGERRVGIERRGERVRESCGRHCCLKLRVEDNGGVEVTERVKCRRKWFN